MSRPRKSAEEIEEDKLLGRALAALRISRGMSQRQVGERAGLTKQQVGKIEHARVHLGHYTVKRILEAMGVSFGALHRAQELARNPTSEVATDAAREQAHRAAVRLAQEAGKAVAHCCLAFMELQAGGWEEGRDGE